MQPSNIILVVLDTFRRDRVGCYGYQVDTTPTLDAFAASATRFDDAVVQAPWSIPSHASIFTGAYPHQHGATTIRPILRTGPTLPELLREAGYDTYGVSPNEYVRPLTGFGRGFDEFHTPSRLSAPGPLVDLLAPGVNAVASASWIRRPVERLFNAARSASTPTVTGREGARDGWTVDRVTSIVEEADSPFFLFANLIDVHLPPSPEPRFFEQYVDEDLWEVPVVADERVHTFNELTMDERGLRKLRQLYDAGVRTADERLDHLLQSLREAGALEDALVVLVSDHGEHLGEFDLVGHQHSVFDSVVSVPLVVKFPGREGGQVVDGQVEVRRIFHTILDETGAREYPDATLASGRRDPVTYGEFFTPMLDVDRLVWDRTVAYDPDLLGERLSFVRADGHKLIHAHGVDRLFRTPERDGDALSLVDTPDQYAQLVDVTPSPAVGD